MWKITCFSFARLCHVSWGKIKFENIGGTHSRELPEKGKGALPGMTDFVGQDAL